MAGSYNHVVNKKTGALSKPEDICGMLQCHSGDVVECIEELYGMIWYLANHLGSTTDQLADIVENARVNYEEGLHASPTKIYFRGKELAPIITIKKFEHDDGRKCHHNSLTGGWICDEREEPESDRLMMNLWCNRRHKEK